MSFTYGIDEILVEPNVVDVNSTRISVSPFGFTSTIPPALGYNEDLTQVVRGVDYSDPVGSSSQPICERTQESSMSE